MNTLKESDYMSRQTEISNLNERNAYGQAVQDLWEEMQKFNIDPIERSRLYGAMVVKHCNYGLPKDSNAYDELESTINKIQP